MWAIKMCRYVSHIHNEDDNSDDDDDDKKK
jgi:hypothetical protein